MQLWNRSIYLLSWVSLGVALLVCAHGRVFIHTGTAIACFIPSLRLLFDRPWRTRLIRRCFDCFAQLHLPTVREFDRWKAALLLLGIPTLVLYGFTVSRIMMGDSRPAMITALSILREGNIELSEYEGTIPREMYLTSEDPPRPYCYFQNSRGKFSGYPFGMTLPAIPVALLAIVAQVDDQSVFALLMLERLASIGVAAFFVMSLFRLGLCLASPSVAWAGAALIMVGSSCYTVIGQALWQHGGVVIGLTFLLIVESDQRLSRSRLGWLITSLSVGWLYLCRMNSGILVLTILVWIFCRDPKRGLRFLLLSALGCLPGFLLYMTTYGSPLGPTVDQAKGMHWVWPSWESFLGVLFSPARGLFCYQPWCVLIVIGTRLARWPSHLRGLTITAWAAIILQCLIIISWMYWWGGATWGPRLLSDILPFLYVLILPAIAWLFQSRFGIGIFFAVMLLSFLPHLYAFYTVDLNQPWDYLDPSTFWKLPSWAD